MAEAVVAREDQTGLGHLQPGLRQAWSVARLGDVVDELVTHLDRVDGVRLGPRERLDVLAVVGLLRLPAGGAPDQQTLDRLAGTLASVLGKSEQQRDGIEAACRRALGIGGLGSSWEMGPSDAVSPAGSAIEPGQDRGPVERRGRRGWWLVAAALLAAAVVAVAVTVLWVERVLVVGPLQPAEQRTTVPTESAPRGAAATGPVSGDADAPLTREEIEMVADAVDGAARIDPAPTLWQIAVGLARQGDVGGSAAATYKRLQLHSRLPTTEALELGNADTVERLLWAALTLDRPGRRADPAIVAEVAGRLASSRPPRGADATPSFPPAASGAYRMPWWLFAATMAAPLLAGAAWLGGRSMRKRRHVEDVLAAGTGRIAPRVSSDGLDPAPLLRQRQTLRAAARHLDARAYAPTPSLDVEATIAATLDRGGIFAPRYAVRAQCPEHLALILTHGPADQEADRLSYVAEALGGDEEGDLAPRRDARIERRYLEHDADRVFTGRDEQRMSLAALAGARPGHRLIVLGTGEGLLDPVTFEPKPWAEALRLWPVRAFATPLPPADWGIREARLSELMGGPLFRTTAGGLEALGAYLRDRADDGRGGVEYLARRERPWRIDPHRFLIEVPFDEDEEWRDLSAELARYLARGRGDGERPDDRGLIWLRTLAVYPVLRWDLTSYLGLRLRVPDATGMLTPLYDEEIATRLSGLPWFRVGSMPRWVRRRLIAGLGGAVRDEVIRAIGELLVTPVPPVAGEPSVRLPVSVAGTAAGEVATTGGEGAAERRTPDDDLAANDSELLELLDAAPTRLLEGRRSWRRWLAGVGARFEASERLAAAVLVAYAGAALWLAPRPWGPAAATGSWWPVALLALGIAMLPVAARLMRRPDTRDGEA